MNLSIGQLAKRTNTKIPTIRYYEGRGLLDEPPRTDGGQRRFDASDLERLIFIRHARALGFSLDAISELIQLQSHPDRSCAEATDIAREQLRDIQNKLERLKRLRTELKRVVATCDGDHVAGDCAILASLADHSQCETDHS